MKLMAKNCKIRNPTKIKTYRPNPPADVLNPTMEVARYSSKFSTTNRGISIIVIINIFLGL